MEHSIVSVPEGTGSTILCETDRFVVICVPASGGEYLFNPKGLTEITAGIDFTTPDGWRKLGKELFNDARGVKFQFLFTATVARRTHHFVAISGSDLVPRDDLIHRPLKIATTIEAQWTEQFNRLLKRAMGTLRKQGMLPELAA